MYKINTLILGKTGAGKSSFINYFYEGVISAAGVGKPVTPFGFHKYEIQKNSYIHCIFDSSGLEANNFLKWKKMLDDKFFLAEKGLDITTWIHNVFYCISSKGARIEKTDLDIISYLLTNSQSVCILLTKSDIAEDYEKEALKRILLREFPKINIFEICSEEKLLRTGEKKYPFGKDKILKDLSRDISRELYSKLNFKIFKNIKSNLKDWLENEIVFLNKEIGVFTNQKKLKYLLEEKWEIEILDIKKILEHKINKGVAIITQLTENPQNIDYFENSFKVIEEETQNIFEILNKNIDLNINNIKFKKKVLEELKLKLEEMV
ncbi:GTPase domain-containing protein [Cetobacterium somerae]|uniref:GTPase domain-containing protein n=1 Tax=Cetobacterium sp. NK01 TaxID=2993530 RepID=UPI002115D80A|nr:GTPase domain-containing protein [Cetobacterium sp. NK01]MCQ8213366.1 GTPase domain-containing protein [Cetobacterium sp. NK01]